MLAAIAPSANSSDIYHSLDRILESVPFGFDAIVATTASRVAFISDGPSMDDNDVSI